MKNRILLSILISFSIVLGFANENSKSILTSNFVEGNPGIKSINALSFGPEGILFIGDSKNATVFAIDTKDTEQNGITKGFRIMNFDDKVAASLGTTKDNIKITDLAVNPISKAIYISVNVLDGTPILLKVVGESIENVSLKNMHYSKIV